MPALLSEPGAHCSTFPREPSHGWSSFSTVRLQALVCCPSVVWLRWGWAFNLVPSESGGGRWPCPIGPRYVAGGEKHGSTGNGESPRVRVQQNGTALPPRSFWQASSPVGCPHTLLGISAMLTPTVACGEVVHPPEWWVGTWAESLRRVTRERTGRGSSKITQVSATQATLFCLQHSNGGFSQLAGG